MIKYSDYEIIKKHLSQENGFELDALEMKLRRICP